MSHWMRIRSTAGLKFSTAEIFLLPRKDPIVAQSVNAVQECFINSYALRRYDNAYALEQIEKGHNSILERKPHTNAFEIGPSKAGKTLPRVITLGGDHTITLPLLRSISKAYGPITVIHFDSHLYYTRPTYIIGAH
jgi:arginase family enzyme